MILRLFETEGHDTRGRIRLGPKVKAALATDLMEREEEEIPLVDGEVSIRVGRYAIETIKCTV